MFREPSSNRRMIESRAIEYSKDAENPAYDDLQRKPNKYERDTRARLNPFRQYDDIVDKTEDESVLLPERDREVLRSGLRALVERLERFEAEDLPPVIVLPETSARPMAYCVKPVLAALYAKKGRPEPSYQFLMLHSSELVMQRREAFLKKDKTWSDSRFEAVEEDLSDQNKLESFGDLLYQDEYITDEKRKRVAEEIARIKDARAEKVQEEIREEAQRLDQAWKMGLERLSEIIDLARARSSGEKSVSLLFIDEYLSQGRTLKLLSSLLQELKQSGKQDVKPMWFAFFESLGVEEKWNRDQELSQLLGGEVWHGVDTARPGYEHFSAFSYNVTPSFSMNRSRKGYAEWLKQRKIGVKKTIGEKYVHRTEISPEVLKLRREIREIGEEMVKELF